MSILIPGMEMPCEGLMTIIAIGYDGRVFQPIEYPDEHTLYHGTKYNAIELPPHGRLIDAGATLLEAIRISGPITGDGWSNWGVYALIERQPTIIPADPKEGADK